jgi:putative beta-lysine N-acetyltransferase
MLGPVESFDEKAHRFNHIGHLVDRIENIEGSIIQHGPHNNCIYLMRLNPNQTGSLITTLDEMALEEGYGKIVAKIPASEWDAFNCADYATEAVVPGFYKGETDGYFIAKYFSAARKYTPNIEEFVRIVKQTGEGSTKNGHRSGKARREVDICKLSDAGEMCSVYRQVFKSYPFPIQQQTYLKRMMKKGVRYFCIRVAGKIAALAAAEIDLAGHNAEMTDFATLPKFRGLGLAGTLLSRMEKKTRKIGIKTAYTIARAASHGMNTVFKNGEYTYAGILKNNSQICGSIQSMTVWYKHL